MVKHLNPTTQLCRLHIILYVKDQERSRDFYSELFKTGPTLDVDGMTEFTVLPNCILGIMPEAGIKRLLGPALPDPESASGIPRAELYVVVDRPKEYHERAVRLGAKELSPLAPRDWGHDAAYSMDSDGHVIAFACTSYRPS